MKLREVRRILSAWPPDFFHLNDPGHGLEDTGFHYVKAS